MSLYGRLFRFRERKHHSPLENFLTEALADLLNRMPRDVVVSLVSELFLAGDELSSKTWTAYIRDKKHLEWITQKSIGSGRLDILLEVDGVATLIVENKIGAPISEGDKNGEVDEADTTDAKQDTEEPETFKSNQLMVYGGWLRDQRGNEQWGGALVLLTLRTLPPADFGRADVKYGVKCQRVCNWRQLWQWLSRTQETDDGRWSSANDKKDWRVFSNELKAFLEENNMNENLLTQRDIAAMEVFWPTWQIMEKLLERCTEAAKEELERGELKTGKVESDTRIDKREYRSWAYLRPPSVANDRDVYVMWGVHFPEESDWQKSIQPYPRWPHVYVWIDREADAPLSDKLLSAIPKPDKPDGWHVTVDGERSVLFATRPLHEFPTKVGEVKDRGIEMAEIAGWVRERVRDIVPTLKTLGNFI